MIAPTCIYAALDPKIFVRKKLPSIAIVIQSGMKPSELSEKFRMASTPILGYIHGKQFYIDLKAITSKQEKILLKVLQDILT